jgi:predicted NBD/HSP70 family sugar kinase
MMQRTRKDLIAESGAVIDALLQAARVDRSSVLGVGIAVPGRQQITRLHPGLRSDETNESYEWAWDALERDFAEQTGMCISVENDSTCGALGEFWISRAPAESELAVVTIAGGIGFGLVTSGDVYRGATSNVGELGHVIVQADGPQCQCGSRGCLELYASPANIVGRALGDVDLTARLALAGDGDSLWSDYERLAIAASLGDGGARDAVIEAAQMLAVALISITNILDLERIVLTGPALDHVGQLVAETVEAELRERAIARSVHPTEVRVSSSGRNAAAVGAATLVIHQQLGSARRSSRWRSRNVAREPAPTASTTSTRIS